MSAAPRELARALQPRLRPPCHTGLHHPPNARPPASIPRKTRVDQFARLKRGQPLLTCRVHALSTQPARCDGCAFTCFQAQETYGTSGCEDFSVSAHHGEASHSIDPVRTVGREIHSSPARGGRKIAFFPAQSPGLKIQDARHTDGSKAHPRGPAFLCQRGLKGPLLELYWR